MRVDGYQIRDALRRWNLRLIASSKQFAESLFIFSGEVKAQPSEVVKTFEEADQAIAKLQELQQYYNLQVKVSVQGREISLSRAVKQVGGAGRIEKMWRDAAIDKSGDRYSYRDERSRNKENEYANRQISTKQALELADAAARYASALRSAVARGNNTELEITTSSPISAQELEKMIS